MSANKEELRSLLDQIDTLSEEAYEKSKEFTGEVATLHLGKSIGIAEIGLLVHRFISTRTES